jgi:hypothetical protein
MPALRKPASRALALGTSVVIVAASTGCERFVAGQESKAHAPNASVSAPMASGCAYTGYPLLTMRTRLDEPSMAVPRPPSWTPARFGDPGAPIRLAMIDKEHRDTIAQSSPVALVALDDFTGKVRTAEEALDYELRLFEAEFVSKSPGILCGHPSVTVSYNRRNHRPGLITLRAVAGEFGSRMYVASVSTMSSQPYNETYLADKQAILDGFAVVFAGKF